MNARRSGQRDQVVERILLTKRRVDMKARSLSVLLLIVLFVAFSTMAFVPVGIVHAQAGGTELSGSQLVIIGLIASAITWVIKVLVQKGYQPKKEVVAIALYVVSFFAAILFSPLVFPAFPPFSDAPTFVAAVFTYIGLLLAVASPVVGMAYLIYNVLLKRVLDAAVAKLQG